MFIYTISDFVYSKAMLRHLKKKKKKKTLASVDSYNHQIIRAPIIPDSFANRYSLRTCTHTLYKPLKSDAPHFVYAFA